MTAHQFIKEMTGMIMDVNPAEIASHIENDSLREWCISWQAKAQTLLVTAPLMWKNGDDIEPRKSKARFEENGVSYTADVTNAKLFVLKNE